ncbi:GNAT family N-acetyltransferase [Staphylococcus massiliensis]|uniref:GNAT family N-acetyltransferase n=1 Tax=Staphylococcus massiliensis TaxID=555791 RepID=UPI001EDE367A|nr:GNAT family N-acetyltransferase [Staphylococcus massiliensis]MCG3402335.1 GNAT family N-acetyltransferase [Staphylococcus massiliensis]
MIETKHLNLIQPSVKYNEDLFNIHSNPVATKYTPQNIHSQSDETKEMIGLWQKHWSEHGYGYFMIIEKEEDKCIGACGIGHKEVEGETFLNVFFRLHPDYTGKGYSKEALSAVLKWEQEKLQLNRRLLVRTDVENIAAIKLAEWLELEYKPEWDNKEVEGDRFFLSKKQ